MIERYRVVPSVHVTVTNSNNELLLLRRRGKGYLDGYWDFPSGHNDPGELPNFAAARELGEEALIEVEPKDLELFHIYLNATTPNLHYLGHMFRAKRVWQGSYGIGEPDKCDDIGFFAMNALPDVIPQVRDALLGRISLRGITYKYYGENAIPGA